MRRDLRSAHFAQLALNLTGLHTWRNRYLRERGRGRQHDRRDEECFGVHEILLSSTRRFSGAFGWSGTLSGTVDKSAEPDCCRQPSPPCRRLTVHLRDRAEREVVGLDAVVDRHSPELGHQRPMPTDHALHKTFVC